MGLSHTHQINTQIYFPWVALQPRPLAHVLEKLHHISGACLSGGGSRVSAGGGGGDVEQQSGEETGGLSGVSLGTAEPAGSARSHGTTSDQGDLFSSARGIWCHELVQVGVRVRKRFG